MEICKQPSGSVVSKDKGVRVGRVGGSLAKLPISVWLRPSFTYDQMIFRMRA